MTTGSFDDLTDLFESMVDWPKRLAFETPFYRRLFEQAGVKRVVDVACGTGHHAALFHSWGLTVEGADISPNMIARARDNSGEPAGLTWTIRGYDQPVNPATPFDAAICVGNSLALAASPAMVQQAITQMLAALRPAGLAIVHVLNLWALPDGPCVWQKNQRVNLPQGPAILIKGVHRCGNGGFVELLTTSLDGSSPLRSRSVPFLGLEGSVLQQTFADAGARDVTLYGGYLDQPYDRLQSNDLILVAQK